MDVIWVAKLETANFSFEAFGTNGAMATRALKDGLIKHCRQYKVSFSDFMRKYNEEMTVGPRLFGGAYRGQEPL
jgi:hypothetical protein